MLRSSRPSGLKCALECADIQLDAEVFEAEPGGQLVENPHSIRNRPAGRFGTGGGHRRH